MFDMLNTPLALDHRKTVLESVLVKFTGGELLQSIHTINCTTWNDVRYNRWHIQVGSKKFIYRVTNDMKVDLCDNLHRLSLPVTTIVISKTTPSTSIRNTAFPDSWPHQFDSKQAKRWNLSNLSNFLQLK